MTTLCLPCETCLLSLPSSTAAAAAGPPVRGVRLRARMPGRTCDTVLCCSYMLCRWNTILCSNSFPTSSCIACRPGAISNRGVLGLFPSGVCGPAPFWACREAPGLDIFGWPDATRRACMYNGRPGGRSTDVSLVYIETPGHCGGLPASLPDLSHPA